MKLYKFAQMNIERLKNEEIETKSPVNDSESKNIENEEYLEVKHEHGMESNENNFAEYTYDQLDNIPEETSIDLEQVMLSSFFILNYSIVLI